MDIQAGEKQGIANDLDKPQAKGSFLEMLVVALRLGLTSFGGPIAHLGYFHEEYVVKRKWVDERTYADLVALCQFLPGPASTQVGISIGMFRAGLLGGIAAWIGFTLPSAIALMMFAYALQGYDVANAGWLKGLLIVAVAVVAKAVWGMAQKLAPDRSRATIVIITAIVTLIWPTALGQVIYILTAGIIGWLFLPKSSVSETPAINVPISRRVATVSWVLFFALLIGLPFLRQIFDSHWVALFDSYFRAGSLVFGGGHVVLPLLQAEVVSPGWVTETQFLAGYGAAQAVPGPLFTFASYLGMVNYGLLGAIVATVAIFLPSFLLITGGLPIWEFVRRRPNFQAALNSINAAVVGILLAALYNPVWIKAIKTPADFSLVIAAFGLLMYWKLPAWAVVLFCVAGGAVIGFFQ